MHFIESQSKHSRHSSDRAKAAANAAITQDDLLDGLVDMDIFNQILALDDADQTREFSKTLVWAWCNQAESAVDEMENSLAADDIVEAASKAHYLKGSSASLGLVRVAKTCQTLYRLHFPPSLAHFKAYSYSSISTPSLMSSSSASSAGSDPPDFNFSSRSSSESSTSSSDASSPGLSCASPTLSSPRSPLSITDFQADKLNRAALCLQTLKQEIREASEWLFQYYSGSDSYVASGGTPLMEAPGFFRNE